MSHVRMGALALAFAGAVFAGCGEQADFGSGKRVVAASAIPKPPLTSKGDPTGETYRFRMTLAGGRPVVRAGDVDVVGEIFGADQSIPLGGDSAAQWKVSYRDEAQNEIARAAPGKAVLPFANARGLVRVEANFTRADGRSGRAQGSIYVDATPPTVALLDVGRDAAGTTRTVFWTATDDFGLDQSKTTVYSCASDSVELTGDALQGSCAVVRRGTELHGQPTRFEVPANAFYFLYAEDLAGHGSATRMTNVAAVEARLALSSPSGGVVYTKNPAYGLPLALAHVTSQATVAVEEDPTLWSDFTLTVSRDGGSAASGAFTTPLAVDLGTVDGTHELDLQAADAGGIKSNRLHVTVVLDRAPPVVSGVRTNVPMGFLEPATQVTINWGAQDENGIVGQTLEIRIDGGAWVKVADLSADARQYTFAWGNRDPKGFEARITARDAAGNAGTAAAVPWFPQFFNAAVLTTSVSCFWCHMRVEGDIAGIDFPSSVHSQTGENMKVTGGIYATNTIPSQLKSASVVDPSRVFENYNNSGMKFFRTQTDKFPSLSVAYLEPLMNGTLRNGDGTRISRIHRGNLIIQSQVGHPIELNGEVLIDGDLIIKGTYTGIGTIYARNVYVVDDLISDDCAPITSPTCPYPFENPEGQPRATEAQLREKAQTAIREGRSALYLGAINRMLIGDTDNNFDRVSDSRVDIDPFVPFLPKAQYEALGRRMYKLVDDNGVPFNLTSGQIPDPTDNNNDRTQVNVERIDAYLYGHEAIVWRSYGNYLINGGFMGDQAVLVATYPHILWHNHGQIDGPLNPRNNLRAKQNVIRYDYRLRYGGKGFEAFKRRYNED